jgi:DNA-binding transcriptional ArsR family regulator
MLNQTLALDRVFQALADPTRRAIVERLVLGAASVSELARPLPMSLAAVVQHVQLLEASGLVRTEKIGRVRTCRIDPATLDLAERWIGQRRRAWEGHFDRLGALLTEQARRTTDSPEPRKKGETS